jgi:hypothetical protein
MRGTLFGIPKKWLVYALIAFLIWAVVKQPALMAHLVHNITNLLAKAAQGAGTFVKDLP